MMPYVLMRVWVSIEGMEYDVVHQNVVPQKVCQQGLTLAHDHALSDHLGIKKTYSRLLSSTFSGLS